MGRVATDPPDRGLGAGASMVVADGFGEVGGPGGAAGDGRQGFFPAAGICTAAGVGPAGGFIRPAGPEGEPGFQAAQHGRLAGGFLHYPHFHFGDVARGNVAQGNALRAGKELGFLGGDFR